MNVAGLQMDSRDKRATLLGSVGIFLLAIVAYLTFRWMLYEPFVIPSGSMIPTLFVNDHIIVKKYAYGIRVPFTKRWLTGPYVPKRGDVVVFRSINENNFYLIKRVVGLPGDHVQYTESGQLIVNGKPVLEKRTLMPQKWTATDLQESPLDFIAFRETLGRHTHWELLENDDFHYIQPEVIVPAGELFVMGDNRDHSRDSRFFGEFPLVNLIGKATWVWLGCSKAISTTNYVCDPRYVHWHGLIHRIE